MEEVEARRSGGLPVVNVVSYSAPFRWLAGGWRDFNKAPVAFLSYGAGVALVCFLLGYGLVRYNAAFWVLTLTCGFVFIAPVLAMGVYEGGRQIEAGQKPSLASMLKVPGVFRQDVYYLGLTLLLIYLLWGRIAQIVYGLSTYRLHKTVTEFVRFAFLTKEGHNMVVAGTIIGGVIAFFTYSIVVISAPMLLDRRNNVFAATATSFMAVSKNFGPLLLWAVLLTLVVAASAATSFVGLVFTLPWLGLASWRAYRDLIVQG